MDWDMTLLAPPPAETGATAMLAGRGARLGLAPTLLRRTPPAPAPAPPDSLLIALVGREEPLPPTPTLPSRLEPLWGGGGGARGGGGPPPKKKTAHWSDKSQ